VFLLNLLQELEAVLDERLGLGFRHADLGTCNNLPAALVFGKLGKTVGTNLAEREIDLQEIDNSPLKKTS
jgi:hypothetical protein